MSSSAKGEIPDLRAALAELEQEERIGSAWGSESLEQAALVGFFDLDWLEQRAGGSPEAKSAVLNASEPLDSKLDIWRLRASDRGQCLRSLASAPDRLTARISQAAPLPDDAAGRALQSLLVGDPGSSDDEATLEAIFEASTWLEDVPSIPSPNPRAIRRELSRRRLQRRYNNVAGRFVGRIEEFERLRAFADGPPPAGSDTPVLAIYGIGGIGKSALLTRLLRDRIQASSPDAKTPLAFHLDFDRFGAVTTNSTEWTFELIRQLAFLMPDVAPGLDQLRKEAQRSYVQRSVGDDYGSAQFESAPEGLEAFSFSEGNALFGTRFLTEDLGVGVRPLVMVFDTVEALQVRSADGLEYLADWISELREKGGFGDIRVILSGRVETQLRRTGFVQLDPIKLDELGSGKAIALLERLELSAEQAAWVVGEFGGNPLILRLVSQLVKRDGVDLIDLASSPDERSRADREVIQGVLYRRILGHVRDETVRDLAHPGLAVRRVTEDVLRSVIAPVSLGRMVDEAEATQLFRALASEVWLVEPAPDGGEAVVHRSDLRKVTMKLIARDENESARAEQVHRAAIDYYETGAGRQLRHAGAESLYHRFMVRGGGLLPRLDSATALRAREAIGSSLDELPRDTLAALRVALDQGVELDEALLLPDYLWEKYVDHRGLELVRRDAFDEAIALTDQRPLPEGSAPPAWRGVALDALARWDELFALLEIPEHESIADQIPVAQSAALLAAAVKSGRLDNNPTRLDLRQLQNYALVLGSGPIDPAILRLHHYFVRSGLTPPANEVPMTTSDLLRSSELATEFVRYIQVLGSARRFRPVQSQFYPSLKWLERLQRNAGDVAGPGLAAFVEEFRSAQTQRMVIGRCLGHYSTAFEALWTEAFARDAITQEALAQLVEVREFPEFRTPARVALLEAFGDPDALRGLANRFAPLLPLAPFDLIGPGLEKALRTPREFVTNLVAFADRCQLLYRLLVVAAEMNAPHARIKIILAGMRRWFTPEEARLYLQHSAARRKASASMPQPGAATRRRGADMRSLDAERLRNYLKLITKKHGGAEEAVSKVTSEKSIVDSGLEAMSFSPDNVAEGARRGVESLALGRELPPEDYFGLEAIINAELRPAIDIVDGTFTVTHPLWTHLTTDAVIKARIEAAIPRVGRLELPGNRAYPYGGTGFVVGDKLIMTNRHVAGIFADGLGDRRLDFKTGQKAGIDFLREQGRPTGPTLEVRRIVMVHPFWDMAILEVEGLPQMRKPLKLSLLDSRDLVGRDICVVGYPAFDPRNPAVVQQELFSGRYGVKRLQPGELQGGMKTASFGKMVPAATHDCSTLGGNSGSAVIDLETGDVLALHFGGAYQAQNYAVPTSELARDSRVVDAGVMFAGKPSGGANEWIDWWKRADMSEGGPPSVVSESRASTPPVAKTPTAPMLSTLSHSDNSVSIELPLRIAVSLSLGTAIGKEAALAVAEAVSEAGLEALREPVRDTDYTTRIGYDPGFLNTPGQDPVLASVQVPMPGALDHRVLAKTLAGDDVLPYQNFSIRMHAKRRLALVTAANVTKVPELRRPDPGRDYTRRGLSGLGENDQERWYQDPRLGDGLQLPDVFFTKDRKAFDKGHIVRRDDVAWGTTYEILRRANGDSYHVTNCSPQVASFNRSADGADNWGDLENHVLSEAANERLCVFAGPVLDPSDEVFVGVGDGRATLRAKIPSRYWKVIVARVQDGIAAYGFVLEQDLADAQFEFAVPAEFVTSMTPIADISAMTGVAFDTSVLAADQFDTERGADVGLRAGARRRARAA